MTNVATTPVYDETLKKSSAEPIDRWRETWYVASGT